MRIALIDDAAEIRTQLSEYIRRFEKENDMQLETLQFSSGDALLKDYRPIYDLLVFDIDMPGTNGMDTARQVRRMDENVVILFITNIAQYAINGYEVEAVDYVLKPISYFDFSMKLKRALRKIKKKQESRLVLDTIEGPVQLDASDIRYVEVLDHMVQMIMGNMILQIIRYCLIMYLKLSGPWTRMHPLSSLMSEQKQRKRRKTGTQKMMVRQQMKRQTEQKVRKKRKQMLQKIHP